MEEELIVIREKPESVTWEQISEVLIQSHANNRENGVYMPYPHLPAEDIRKKIEGRGIMLVAMDAEKLVGTAAMIFLNKKLWCGSGKYAYCCFASVLPEYSGRGIYRRLLDEEHRIALSKGYERMMFDTHEGNTRIIAISKKAGYKSVEYRVRHDHNSVLMVKWLKKQPLPDFIIAIVFGLIRRIRLLRRD